MALTYPRILRTTPLPIIVVVQCRFVQGKAIYVDDDVTSTKYETSWENTYNYLQDAPAAAALSEP